MVASSSVRFCRDGVTLNFDLLTQKRNQVICVPRCTSDKGLAKIRQQILEISRNIKLPRESRTDARMDGQRHGRTTRKHIASAGAYRRRRLKNQLNSNSNDYQWSVSAGQACQSEFSSRLPF